MSIGPAPATDLAALLADPPRAAEVPPDLIPGLLTLIAAQQARLASVEAALAVRLLSARSEEARARDGDTLDAGEAAARLKMSVSWVYRNAKRLPFTRRIGPRTLRFSADGIRRYLAAHRSG